MFIHFTLWVAMQLGPEAEGKNMGKGIWVLLSPQVLKSSQTCPCLREASHATLSSFWQNNAKLFWQYLIKFPLPESPRLKFQQLR